MKSLVYYLSKNRRSRSVTQYLCQGLLACHEEKGNVILRDESAYTKPEAVDCVMLYGLKGNMMRIMKEYREAGVTTCFVDLGYFGRKRESPPFFEYHRIAINSYQPTAYLRRNLPPSRFLQFSRPIMPWRIGGEEILVVGMSDKAAKVWQLGSGTEHAQWLVDEVRKHTDRPIAYSPKPSWQEAEPIAGTRYARGPLQDELRRAHAVVTWRSNVAIDGLIAGIPCFVLGDNPALLMSHNDLTKIEQPHYPEDRLEFCADLGWCQFSLQELSSGYAFRMMRGQGLIP